MKQKKCGKYDLKLSALGLGCWKFGSRDYCRQDIEDAVAIAVANGITYFDTAETYQEGQSEVELGYALRNIQRDKVVIGSKVYPSNCYKKELKTHCEASLKRLKTDYIDLYMIHWPINNFTMHGGTEDKYKIQNPPSLNEAIESLEKLKKAGKIRYYGVSNFGHINMEKAMLSGGVLTVNELPYNLLCRAIELEAVPFCESNGVGIIAYICLFQGLLSGKYSKVNDIPELMRRSRHFSFEKNPMAKHSCTGFEQKTAKALRSLIDIANTHNVTLPELAMKWTVSNPAVSCSLIGTLNPLRIEAMRRAVSTTLPEEIRQELDSATTQLRDAMGANFDYYYPAIENRINA